MLEMSPKAIKPQYCQNIDKAEHSSRYSYKETIIASF